MLYHLKMGRINVLPKKFNILLKVFETIYICLQKRTLTITLKSFTLLNYMYLCVLT